MRHLYLFAIMLLIVILGACKSGSPDRLFTKLSPDETGIDFNNKLIENNAQFNIMQYPYFYNGGGVAVGDLNNDGLPDLVFTGNMVKNRLYINKGNFKFDNVTDQAGIALKEGWCTGATMVDINGDGWLDIYICRSGFPDAELRKNLLFINNQNLTFTEAAAQYGIDDPGYSTQASFFDYDKDGDLDLFVINQSQPKYAQGGQEYAQLRNKRGDSLFENHLYRNDGGHFTNITSKSGIYSNALSFSLGISTADINQDGWPDIYVANDFNEPDYLFINNQDGTFSNRLDSMIDHTCLYSMGCDVADYDNDGLPDICTLDMLPESNHAIKMHFGADNYDKFNYLFKLGYGGQYMKNSLQKNNGDGTFSEIGQLAGISNTDWSWSPLFADFDNDGRKDLFISNGYKRDNTNLQFIKYTMNEALRMQRGGEPVKIEDYIAGMESISLDNYMYRNAGDDHFENKTREWGLGGVSFSNGAIYADLDNDGDLDLITNNIEEAAGVYRNNSDKKTGGHYLRILLKGSQYNMNGIGTKIYAYRGGRIFYQEQSPVRGYQSSVDMAMVMGLGLDDGLDSLRIIWPDGRTQLLQNIHANQAIQLKLTDAAETYNYVRKMPEKIFNAGQGVINYLHHENEVNDFNRQFLLPHFYSQHGPCMAKADVNGDGLEDIYVGGSTGGPGAIFLQTKDRHFVLSIQPSITRDSSSEDAAAVFFDANGDGHPDLYIASGGYDGYRANDPLLEDRLYINNGKGNFTRSSEALPQNYASKTCVKVCDIDKDGDMDLFVGAGVEPGNWPRHGKNSILINDGHGTFIDQTAMWNAELVEAGIVKDATWADINKDGFPDLILVGEWMQPTFYINQKNKLVYADANKELAGLTGWWNTLVADDFDKDGDTDFVIGNYGTNGQLKPSLPEPVELYATDIDGNGSVDPILTSYIQGKSYPFVAMDDINAQVPSLRKKFYDYPRYADATIGDVIPADKLSLLKPLQAKTFETIWLENKDGKFLVRRLPPQAQYAPVYSIVSTDVNKDGFPDLLLFGNNQYNRIRLGNDDANHGTVLINDAKGNFINVPHSGTGISVKGDTRSALIIGDLLFVGVNNSAVKTWELSRRQDK